MSCQLRQEEDKELALGHRMMGTTPSVTSTENNPATSASDAACAIKAVHQHSCPLSGTAAALNSAKLQLVIVDMAKGLPHYLDLGVLGFGIIELQVGVAQAQREQAPLQRKEGQVLVKHLSYPLGAPRAHTAWACKNRMSLTTSSMAIRGILVNTFLFRCDMLACNAALKICISIV